MARTKGSVNRSSRKVRDAIASFANMNAKNFQSWIARVAEDNPEKAADLYLKAIEYHIPKLQRTEHTGADGEQLTINHILETIETPTIPKVIEAQPIDAEYEKLIDHGIIEEV